MKAPTVKHNSERMYAFSNPGLGGDGGFLRLHRMEVRVRGRQTGEVVSPPALGETENEQHPQN